VVERRVATYEVEYEVVDEGAVLDAVFRDGRPAVDPSQHLGLAINELMRPALTTAPGVRFIRARGHDRPMRDQES
jgi:hypothetical protein